MNNNNTCIWTLSKTLTGIFYIASCKNKIIEYKYGDYCPHCGRLIIIEKE